MSESTEDVVVDNTGLFIAYAALGIGAIVPIIVGSIGSVSALGIKVKKEKKKGEESDSDDEDSFESNQSESLSANDAMWFPIMGSGTLFGLYVLFKYFGKEYINYLLTGYFAILGAFSVAKMLSLIVKQLINTKKFTWNEKYRIKIWTKKETHLKTSIDYINIGAGIIAVYLKIFFTAYYVLTKNWIASNIFGEAFATTAIQMLDLDDFKTGMMLLSGLFFYDIFWVFGTDVMVTVAKSFDAPIKILFPRDIFAEESKFSMLGLGDIVIPGIFVALCMRFDQSLSKDPRRFSKPYFTACLIAYIIGLATTMFVMHTYKAAQPALLYLSPACILSVLFMGLVRGELTKVFDYTSEASKKKTKDEAAAKSKEEKKKEK